MGRVNISDELYFRCKVFLESLRRSGRCNMYGAASYLMEEFNMSENTAVFVLQQWMQTYNANDYNNIDFDSYEFKTI